MKQTFAANTFAAWSFNAGAWAGLGAAPVYGPLFFEAATVFQPGSVAATAFQPGSVAATVYQPGADAGATEP